MVFCWFEQIFGIDFLKFPPVSRKAELALPNIIYHLCQLEADLVQGEYSNLFSDDASEKMP